MGLNNPSRRGLFAGAAAAAGVLPSLVRAEETGPAPPRIVIVTNLGEIKAELYPDKAPVTAKNFLRYVQGRRFDGTSFYRAVKTPGAPPGSGFIQGGTQNDPKRVFAPIAHESTVATGLKHADGTLSMARAAPGSATGDFFITLGPSSFFDADPSQPGDNLGYAAFGQVTDGLDVARNVLALPTGGAARNPAMNGQMLSPPAPILKIRLLTT